MKYHNITHDDMLNGEGLRVVLWLSGCEHLCDGCQNSFTSNYEGGLDFDKTAKEELFSSLKKDHINGVTFSGGDPLYHANRPELISLIQEINEAFPNKTIWLYTGYQYEEILKKDMLGKNLNLIDVLVDGKFNQKLIDIKYKWAGSTNQKVIDIKKTLKEGSIVLYANN